MVKPARPLSAVDSKVSLTSRAGRGIIAAGVLGSALAYMSDDMLNVAIPTMSNDLAVGVTEMQFVVNGYFVTMLALMLTAGSIGDIRGHRRTFLEGLVVFCVGAVICAFAPTVALLVAGRAIQGVGAAFLLASGLALVNGSFADDERGRAVGLYMGLTAVSTAAGPVLGGLLVDVLSWRAIFLAPLVFPLAAAIVTYLRVPETPADAERRPDAKGAALAFLTIAAFSFALIRGPADWFGGPVVAAIVIAMVGAVLFLRTQRRAEDPMLALDLFRSRTFSGGNAVTLISYLVSAGVFFFVVVHLQSTLGYQPAAAGAALMPLYIIMLIGSPLAGRIADRVGPRIPMVAGLGIIAVGVWWISTIGVGSRYLSGVLPALGVFSIGLALMGAPVTIAVLGSVGDQDQGVASGINNTVGQLAGLLMIAVLPAAAGLAGTGFDDPTFADGFERAMHICAGLAVAAAVIAATTIRSSHEQQP
jgi:EmrB/QacA subfamily drug resistance transporter